MEILATGGTVLGGVLSVVVAGLFIFFGTAGKPEVPLVKDFTAPLPPGHGIVVCRDAPAWVDKELSRATAFWTAHGVSYGPTLYNAPCDVTCNVKGRPVTCNLGMITLDLRDRAFSDDHAGETIIVGDAQGHVLWATSLFPVKVLPGEAMDAPNLPKDVYALVLTHELGHAEAYGHSITRVSKGVVAEKTGEVMNAHAEKLGWGAAGLP